MDKIVKMITGQNCWEFCNVVFNDIWFNENVMPDVEFLESKVKLIEKLDDSKLDLSTMTLTNGYGTCSISRLATGIKCLLNCMFLKEKHPQDKFVVFYDAGDNIFSDFCEVVANSNILLCVTRDIMVMPDDYTYILNAVKVKDALDFIDILYEHLDDVITSI